MCLLSWLGSEHIHFVVPGDQRPALVCAVYKQDVDIKLWKSLPDQLTTAPLDLNRPINQLNAAKRAQRHTEKEAARKHEDGLLNRTDLDVRGKRLYTLLWLKQMDAIMRRWCEFHTVILGRYSGPEYFQSWKIRSIYKPFMYKISTHFILPSYSISKSTSFLQT